MKNRIRKYGLSIMVCLMLMGIWNANSNEQIMPLFDVEIECDYMD